MELTPEERDSIIAESGRLLSGAWEQFNRCLQARFMLGFIRMSEYKALGKPVPPGGIGHWIVKKESSLESQDAQTVIGSEAGP